MSNQAQKKANPKKKFPLMFLVIKIRKIKSATAISLEKLRKSKAFRELGDAFDYFSD